MIYLKIICRAFGSTTFVVSGRPGKMTGTGDHLVAGFCQQVIIAVSGT
ncbi:hypothetical protein [Bradyrhizobium sp. WD16]|nr:hypothetical protein [Bradyrhizobium sp. WD16]